MIWINESEISAPQICIMKYTNKIIDQVLEDNKTYLGKQYDKYRNHVYRVFAFCIKLDNSEQNIDKYAIASIFHDIGIWTNNSFDYLEPSIFQAKQYLIETDRKEWIEEITLMIDMHHKRSKYLGLYEETVETFRRADWIDVSKGRKSFKIAKKEIREISEMYPNLGFHRFLIFQTLKNLFKNPLNPLPMFKK